MAYTAGFVQVLVSWSMQEGPVKESRGGAGLVWLASSNKNIGATSQLNGLKS